MEDNNTKQKPLNNGGFDQRIFHWKLLHAIMLTGVASWATNELINAILIWQVNLIVASLLISLVNYFFALGQWVNVFVYVTTGMTNAIQDCFKEINDELEAQEAEEAKQQNE